MDILFPVSCIACGSEHAWLCAACERAIPYDHGACIFCSTRSLHGITCRTCRRGSLLAAVIAVGPYRHPVLREAVHALKFEGVRDLAFPLGTMLARRTHAALGPTLSQATVVPIPLHPRREHNRGFNQSALLAKQLAQTLSLPCMPLLRRTRHTPPQTSVTTHVSAHRRENVAAAFGMAEQMAPPAILLVDDVATTGSTLEEAAKVLYAHGAQTVWGAVVCRG